MTKQLISALALFLMVLTMMPQSNSVEAQNLVDRIDVVCKQLPNRAISINKEIQNRESVLEKTYINVLSNLDKRQNSSNSRIIEIRKNAEERRFEAYKTLRQRGDNDANKLAIEVFISSMEKAVNDRQSAYDKAILKFQEAIRQKSQENINAAKEAVTNFKDGVTSVLDDTNASCSTDNRLAEIRQNFISRLKNARLSYSGKVNSVIGRERNEIIKNRNEELSRARALFEETVRSITVELNAILGD